MLKLKFKIFQRWKFGIKMYNFVLQLKHKKWIYSLILHNVFVILPWKWVFGISEDKRWKNIWKTWTHYHLTEL